MEVDKPPQAQWKVRWGRAWSRSTSGGQDLLWCIPVYVYTQSNAAWVSYENKTWHPWVCFLLSMCPHLSTCSLVDIWWMPNKCRHIGTRNYLTQRGHSKMSFVSSIHIIHTEYIGTSIVLCLCMVTPIQLPHCWTKWWQILTIAIPDFDHRGSHSLPRWIVFSTLNKARNAKSITIYQTSVSWWTKSWTSWHGSNTACSSTV